MVNERKEYSNPKEILEKTRAFNKNKNRCVATFGRKNQAKSNTVDIKRKNKHSKASKVRHGKQYKKKTNQRLIRTTSRLQIISCQ